MNCLICFERFDAQTKAPLVIRTCGHSACQACLQSLLQRAIKASEPTMRCPFCQAPEPIPGGITDVRKVFPVNYLFVQSLTEEQQAACDHPPRFRKFICVDPKCTAKSCFCLDCSRKNHSQCNEGSVMEQTAFESNTNFVRLFEPAQLFSKKEVRKEIEKQLNELRNMLFSIADETEAIVSAEYGFLQKARNSPDFYVKNASAFTVEQTQTSAKMSVTLKSESHLFDLCGSITKLLTVDVWEVVRERYNRLMLDNGVAFMSLNAPAVTENRETINRFLKTELFALKDRAANFPHVAHPFTLEKYVNSIKKYLKDTTRKFFEKESLDMPNDTKQAIFNACESVIDDDSVQFSAAKNAVVKRLTDKFPTPGSRWELETHDKNFIRVAFNQFSYLTFGMRAVLSEAAFFG